MWKKILNLTNHQRNANQSHNEIYLTPIRVAIIRRARVKGWWRCGKKEPMYTCWWVYTGIAIRENRLPSWLSWQRSRLWHRRPWFDSWVGKIRWRRDRLPTLVFLDFPCDSTDKEYACNVRDLGLIPGLGRSPGEGKDYPLQCSGLENSMDCIVHGVTKSWTWLSKFHKGQQYESSSKKLLIGLHKIQQSHFWVYIQKQWNQ